VPPVVHVNAYVAGLPPRTPGWCTVDQPALLEVSKVKAAAGNAGGAGGVGGGIGGVGGTDGTGGTGGAAGGVDGGNGGAGEAQSSKPFPTTEPSLVQVNVSPAAIGTRLGPLLPLYNVPPIVM